jgi:hypothetical protein
MLLLAAALTAGSFSASSAQAYDSCYYSSWSYYPARTYYYSYCYYQQPATTNYGYHYSIYYPSTPRYVYYYNPYRRVYWGRYDLEQKGYSMLDEKDRKANLKDIPETAFPKPGMLPQIPGAKDGVALVAPPAPPKEAPPKDAPESEPKK